MVSDMLVKLYELPLWKNDSAQLAAEGIDIRRAMAPDKIAVVSFVRETFGDNWASECDISFSNKPVTCMIAVKEKKVIGFACYEATARDYFGPTGVDEAYRGKGIGKELLLGCMQGLRDMGYAYGVIGGVGAARGFYQKTVGAIDIPDTFPSIYKDMIGFDARDFTE